MQNLAEKTVFHICDNINAQASRMFMTMFVPFLAVTYINYMLKPQYRCSINEIQIIL